MKVKAAQSPMRYLRRRKFDGGGMPRQQYFQLPPMKN